jgi:hypothetical protein
VQQGQMDYRIVEFQDESNYDSDMKKGGVGGAKTAKAGADFEKISDNQLIASLSESGYEQTFLYGLNSGGVAPHALSMEKSGSKIDIFYKAGIYKYFFEPRGIDAKKLFSARLEPDSAIYSYRKKILTIIEKKQQTGAGSVAEKLQTCDYKKYYYEKLLEGTGIKLEIVWLLGPYFYENRAGLASVFEYMESKGSRYYFEILPVEELAL